MLFLIILAHGSIFAQLEGLGLQKLDIRHRGVKSFFHSAAAVTGCSDNGESLRMSCYSYALADPSMNEDEELMAMLNGADEWKAEFELKVLDILMNFNYAVVLIRDNLPPIGAGGETTEIDLETDSFIVKLDNNFSPTARVETA